MDLEAIRRAYARYAPIYDHTFSWMLARQGRRLAATTAAARARVILELGVGTGLTLPLYPADRRLVGIDISPDMLALAQRRARERKLGQVAGLSLMDAGNLAFCDASFDAVVAAYVMSVVPEPAAVLAEAARVCRPGGDIVLVNHFAGETVARRRIERALEPLADWLGWRPAFGFEELMAGSTLRLVERRPLAPFGLFTLVHLRKPA
ncbi:MAG: class I SAM-dependent methyltransferase [Alphaproteobacteria bacterium]|nr:class I SAM-dependent methyltransferase [Alphaproteobacteria bacterium]